MDFRELNGFVDVFMANANVFAQGRDDEPPPHQHASRDAGQGAMGQPREKQLVCKWMWIYSLGRRKITGVMMEADRSVIEDVCWLCPMNNMQHINLTELDAVLKGVNLTLQWQVKMLHFMTDSACIHQWISNALTGKA